MEFFVSVTFIKLDYCHVLRRFCLLFCRVLEKHYWPKPLQNTLKAVKIFWHMCKYYYFLVLWDTL